MEIFLGILIPFIGTTLGAACVLFMKKTLTNIFYSCCVQLLGIIVPLITSPYISRILRPTNLGIYTYPFSR